MNEENTNKLFKRFDFFKPENPQTQSLMCYGFVCRDGWYPLITELSVVIRDYLDKNPDLKKDFEVVQVKEKFGGLRYYVHGGDDKIHEFINAAEGKSYETCEVCGEQGKIRDDIGWIQTLCENDYKEYVRSKNEKVFRHKKEEKPD